MIGSPSNLELLLHCYYSPDPHERIHAPAIQDGVAYLLQQKMIESSGVANVWRATDKGEAFIRHLMTIPFPESVWVIRQQAEAA